MSFPKQDSVLARLTAQNLSVLDAEAAKYKGAVRREWARAARELRSDIHDAYRWAAPTGEWNLGTLAGSGAWHALQAKTAVTLNRLHASIRHLMGTGLLKIKDLGRRRQLWALAQVVPESCSVRLRHKAISRAVREAKVPLAHGWEERWGEWTRAYHTSLLSNLRMNALNEGGMSDAVGEVSATRAGTPAFSMDTFLDRLWEYWAAAEAAGGMHQAVLDAPDEAEVEIWRTRGDLRVCDDCDANDGMPAEDADGEIPLHPNCHCFYQVVPASFAALLRSGDADDRDLAEQMDSEGVVPNALVVRGDDGELAGRAVVDFGDWEAGKNLAVSGRAEK